MSCVFGCWLAVLEGRTWSAGRRGGSGRGKHNGVCDCSVRVKENGVNLFRDELSRSSHLLRGAGDIEDAWCSLLVGILVSWNDLLVDSDKGARPGTKGSYSLAVATDDEADGLARDLDGLTEVVLGFACVVAALHASAAPCAASRKNNSRTPETGSALVAQKVGKKELFTETSQSSQAM